MEDADGLEHARRTLGSLSHFMKHLKQPIARQANLEDDCTGHFFEQRFYSGALLSQEALLAAMVYVDLNPVRASEVRELIECQDTSIGERLQEHHEEALEGYLAPVASGLGRRRNRGRGAGGTEHHPSGVYRTVAGHGCRRDRHAGTGLTASPAGSRGWRRFGNDSGPAAPRSSYRRGRQRGVCNSGRLPCPLDAVIVDRRFLGDRKRPGAVSTACYSRGQSLNPQPQVAIRPPPRP